MGQNRVVLNPFSAQAMANVPKNRHIEKKNTLSSYLQSTPTNSPPKSRHVCLSVTFVRSGGATVDPNVVAMVTTGVTEVTSYVGGVAVEFVSFLGWHEQSTTHVGCMLNGWVLAMSNSLANASLMKISEIRAANDSSVNLKTRQDKFTKSYSR